MIVFAGRFASSLLFLRLEEVGDKGGEKKLAPLFHTDADETARCSFGRKSYEKKADSET